MTDTLARPAARPTSGSRRAARSGPEGQPAWFGPVPAAVVGVLVAVGVGVVVCAALAVLAWVAAPEGDLVGATRVGTWIWLLANGGRLEVSAAGPGTVDSTVTTAVGFSGPVAIAPLGLTLLLLALLARTTAAVIRSAVPDLLGDGIAGDDGPGGRIRRDPRRLLLVAALTIACYLGATTVVARYLARGSALVHVDLHRTLAGAGVVAVVGVALGVVGGSGGLRRVLRSAPVAIAAAVRGALAGAVLLTAAATLLVGVELLGHLDRVGELSRAIGGGRIGQSLLTLGQLALAPQWLSWAVSWMAGPGFTIGAGTIVAPTGVILGPLPAVPVLGALPDPGPQPLWATSLVVVPALAGLLAGIVAVLSVARVARAGRGTHPGVLPAAAVGAGLTLGLGTLAVLAAARAQLGTGRLAEVGPVVGASALVLVPTCALGAALAALPAAIRAVLPARAPLDGVNEGLGARLRRRLGRRVPLDAGDVGADLGPEGDDHSAHQQDEAEPDGAEGGGDTAGGGAGPGPAGRAHRADAGHESDEGEHDGDEQRDAADLDRPSGEDEADDPEDPADDRDPERPATGPLG